MPRQIRASVGRMGGRNLPDDVRTVQELLNEVPATEGGPTPPLVPDSLCGPKTIGAIQRFQLHHFGFSGADGRVDPGGRTLAKLNEFDRQRLEARSIRRVGISEGPVDPDRPEQWFFEIRDNRGRRAVYHLGERDEHKRLPRPLTFAGEVRTFQTTRSVFALATRGASYTTQFLVSDDLEPTDTATSTLNLVYLTPSGDFERLRIFCPDPILPSRDPISPGLEVVPFRRVSAKSGFFQLVP
jgi:hypothetical protein